MNSTGVDEAGPPTSRSGPAVPTTRAGRAGTVFVPMPLQGPDLSPERVKAEQAAMFGKAADTADVRGSKAYAVFFGTCGVASRLAAWGIDAATGAEAGTVAFYAAKAAGMATALSMPLMHNTAGSKVAPFQFPCEAPPTFCVQPDPDKPIPMGNLVGESFRPFIGWLSAGNTAANAAAQGVGYTFANAAGLETGEIVEKGLNVVLPWIPGNIAAAQTARNIVSGQLALGFSLSEPIRGLDGSKDAGRLVVHQKPVEKVDGPAELGHLILQHESSAYRLSVRDVPAGENAVIVEALPQPEAAPQRSLASMAKDLGRYMVPNHQTVAKTAALASTLAGIGAVTLGLTPKLKEGMIASDVDPRTANEVTKLTNYALANYLLGTDFMQKFQSFTEPAATYKDMVAKIGWASIPIFGGAIAAARRPAPKVPGLSEAQFETLAKNKFAVMKRLEVFAGQPSVVWGALGEIAIDNEKIMRRVLGAVHDGALRRQPDTEF